MIIYKKDSEEMDQIHVDGMGSIIFTTMDTKDWGQHDKPTVFKNFKILLPPGKGWSREDIIEKFTEYLDKYLTTTQSMIEKHQHVACLPIYKKLGGDPPCCICRKHKDCGDAEMRNVAGWDEKVN